MANNESNQINEESTKKKKPSIIIKLLIVFVLLAVVAAGSVIGYVKFSEKKDIVVESIYSIAADTYNLNPSEGGTFAKISISLAYQDDSVLKAIEKDIAVIKDSIILTLSDKSGSDLITSTQKENLKKELIEKINNNLKKYNGNLEDSGITNLYFDSFVIN